LRANATSVGALLGSCRRRRETGTLKRLARILPLVAVVSAVLATVGLVFSHRAAFAYSDMRPMLAFPSSISIAHAQEKARAAL
jgi:peptidoglycan/LPS O-acetylase OafA/YrhL